jgi:hypothetical protein
MLIASTKEKVLEEFSSPSSIKDNPWEAITGKDKEIGVEIKDKVIGVEIQDKVIGVVIQDKVIGEIKEIAETKEAGEEIKEAKEVMEEVVIIIIIMDKEDKVAGEETKGTVVGEETKGKVVGEEIKGGDYQFPINHFMNNCFLSKYKIKGFIAVNKKLLSFPMFHSIFFNLLISLINLYIYFPTI